MQFEDVLACDGFGSRKIQYKSARIEDCVGGRLLCRVVEGADCGNARARERCTGTEGAIDLFKQSKSRCQLRSEMIVSIDLPAHMQNQRLVQLLWLLYREQ